MRPRSNLLSHPALIATGYERRYGVLKRLGTTPLSRAGLLTAKTINVLLVEVLQCLLVVGVGMALGWDPTTGLLPAFGLLLAGTVAFAGVGLLLAGAAERNETVWRAAAAPQPERRPTA